MVSLPSERFVRFGNPAWPGVRTAYFAAFGSWSEALLKDTESLRDSDALMRVAVPRRRGPAGLRNLFTFVEVAACTPCAQSFLCVRGMGGITTLGALCVLLKYRTAACQSGSFAIFRGQVVIIDSSGAKYMSRFLSEQDCQTQTAPVPCERNRSCFLRHFM